MDPHETVRAAIRDISLESEFKVIEDCQGLSDMVARKPLVKFFV